MWSCGQDARLDEPWDMDPRKRDMTTLPSPEGIQLQGLLLYESEDLGVEYKEWLDLTTDHGRAVLAKAAIAVSNHGGGYLVLGFANRSPLQPSPVPQDLPEVTSDRVNEAVRRYSNPEFQCQTYFVPHPGNSVRYPVIRVPASDVPVMCKRDQGTAELAQYKVYVRKPGPRSEEPHTPEEWRALLDRCVRARREDMLDAIRSIVQGRVAVPGSNPSIVLSLDAYCEAAYERWKEVVKDEPLDSPTVFPTGHFELGFALANATEVPSLPELNDRLRGAHRVRLSGWPLFLELRNARGWESRPQGDFIETWLGRDDSGRLAIDYYDFWRASRAGELYIIEGHPEDGIWGESLNYGRGFVLSGTMPIQRLAEGLLYTARLAESFQGASDVVIRCKFTGLKDRSLVWSRTMPYTDWDKCYQSEVTVRGQASLSEIQDNLPEVIYGVLQPLYGQFNFFRLTIDAVREVTQELLGA